jgi:hypothetical protein
MRMRKRPNKIVGETKTVLVCHSVDNPVAFVTQLKAVWLPGQEGTHIDFVGPLGFDSQARQHLQDCVLPIVDGIRQAFGLPNGYFQLSGSNLGAASARDAGLDVTGYSADLPVFLCLVSALLNLPINQGLLSTGHIASNAGEVKLVKSLPEKLRAALGDKNIKKFVYPDLRSDASLDRLVTDEISDARNTLEHAKKNLACISVGTVLDLVLEVWPESERLLALCRLKRDWNEIEVSQEGDVVSRIAGSFFENAEQRFYQLLQKEIQMGQVDTGLLNAWVDAHVRWKRYPVDMGKHLFEMVKSLPQFIQCIKLKGARLSMKRCLDLSLIAGEKHFLDVFLIYEATHLPSKQRFKIGPREPLAPTKESSVLQLVMAEISATQLAQIIGMPIDEARSSFVLDSVIVQDAAQLEDVIQAFYVHLRSGKQETESSITGMTYLVEANLLLEEAFRNDGGYEAVLAEAQTGIQGGLRMILDRLTEHYKHRQKESYVNYVLKMALDAFDWQGKIDFMKSFFVQCPDAIPEELRAEDPTRYAKYWKLIIQNYIQSMERIQSLIRTL